MGFRVLLILFLFFPNLAIIKASYYAKLIRLPNGDSYGYPFNPTRVTQISWHPRAFLYRNFLTDQERDHLVQLLNQDCRNFHGNLTTCSETEKGDVLLFFSLHPNATTVALSLHGSCPVIEGEKWSATKWIHVRNFDKADNTSDKCKNEDVNCSTWAASGECIKNPVYMVGSPEGIGYCRKSCEVC